MSARKASKALPAAPDPVRHEYQRNPQTVESATDSIADDARRLKTLLVVIERIAGDMPTDTYLGSDWSASDFIGLTDIGRERAEALVREAEAAPRP